MITPSYQSKPRLLCALCSISKAILKRPKTGQQICQDCFFQVFELEIHQTIINNHLFEPGMKVAIGASGGKDSTVLAHVLTTLNARYSYGLDLFLLSIDEGIRGYRDDSLETVKQNQIEYGLPLKILSYKDLYGWSMDEIVTQVGLKNNCTFCGVFRRQALDRGADLLKVDQIVTGHNADDIAETVMMNVLRGDWSRLGRCTVIQTQTLNSIPRSKPLKYTYEKEIVMYAYFKKLTYFSTECTYSPEAYRGFARSYIKDLESIRPTAILDIIHSGESFSRTSPPSNFSMNIFSQSSPFSSPGSESLVPSSIPSSSPSTSLSPSQSMTHDMNSLTLTSQTSSPSSYPFPSPSSSSISSSSSSTYFKKGNLKPAVPIQQNCTRCGYMSSNPICKACNLLEGLNRGLPQLGIGNTARLRKKYGIQELESK